MRTKLKLFILCLSLVPLSQINAASTLFIYVDPSGIDDRELLFNSVKEQVVRGFDNYVIFISNMESPIILTDTSGMNTKLRKLLYMRPSGLQLDNELDTLIGILASLTYKSTGAIESRFFFSESQCWNYYQVYNFVNMLVLSLGTNDAWKRRVVVYVDADEKRLRQRHRNHFLNLQINKF